MLLVSRKTLRIIQQSMKRSPSNRTLHRWSQDGVPVHQGGDRVILPSRIEGGARWTTVESVEEFARRWAALREEAVK